MKQNLIATATETIAASKLDVWSALVTPAAIEQYMFGAEVTSEWEVGSPIVWKGEWQGEPYEDRGENLEFDSPRTTIQTNGLASTLKRTGRRCSER